MGAFSRKHAHMVSRDMNEVTHQKSLLLVEDQEQFYAPISRWLAEEGYQVTLASSLTDAQTCLETGHYHLAIVDIRLQDDDPPNQEGMKLLEEIERRGLSGVTPSALETAYANVQNILTATQVRHVLAQDHVPSQRIEHEDDESWQSADGVHRFTSSSQCRRLARHRLRAPRRHRPSSTAADARR